MIMPSTPQETIDDVIAHMDAVLERCIRERSRLGYFAALYRGVTVRVRDGIAAGRFEDGPRMERLDVIFANRYLDAIERRWRGELPTQSWSVAFGAADAVVPTALQHLLLGMNAHINLDLGIAAAQTVPGSELPGLKRDFDEITALLNDMLETVQERVERVSPWLALLDYVGGRTDEQICGFGMQAARELAWQQAVQLARRDATRVDGEIVLHDQVVAGLGKRIRSPAWNLKVALGLIRLRETGDVLTVIEALRT